MTLKYYFAKELFLRIKETKKEIRAIGCYMAMIPDGSGRRVRKYRASVAAIKAKRLQELIEEERVLRAYAHLLVS